MSPYVALLFNSGNSHIEHTPGSEGHGGPQTQGDEDEVPGEEMRATTQLTTNRNYTTRHAWNRYLSNRGNAQFSC